MTRLFQHRHYAVIADALAEHSDFYPDLEPVVDSLVYRFKKDNSAFDEERFRAACNDRPTTKDARSGKALR
jgi:hypothetical protein